MLRLILILLLLILFFILSLPLLGVLFILKKFKPKLSSKISQTIAKAVFRVIMWLTGSKVTVLGEQNIPKDEAVLFVSNHRSYFDIVVGYGYTPKLLGFIAKSEMKKVIILRQWMVLVNCLFLDRKNIKEGLKTILSAIEKVNRGVSMWICPEGTRHQSADVLDLAEFHEGSLKIAEKSSCAVIPVAIRGSYEIFEAQCPKVKPSHVVIEYGKPIYLNELDKENKKRAGGYTRELIINMLKSQEKLL